MTTRDNRTTVLIVEEAVAFGGSIVSTAQLARSIDPGRVRLIVAIAADPDLIIPHLVEAEETTEVVHVRPFLDYQRLERIRTTLRKAAGRMRLPKADVGINLFLTLLRTVANLPWSLRISFLILSRGVDIVQFNNGFGNEGLTLVTRALGRAPVVFMRGYFVGMSGLDRKLLVPRLNACVSVSQYVKDEAVLDGVDPDIIHVATPPAIPSGKPTVARSEIWARYGVPPGSRVLSVFGRVIQWKGHLEFFRAAKIVAETIDNLAILIVGDESDAGDGYATEVRRFVESNGLADKVIFTGYVTDVASMYQASDVVAHTAVLPEPSGRVVFEAMSYGVPLVVSSLGGPKEFIEDGVDGFVVHPEETETLANRLCTLLSNEELAKEMADRAQRKLRTEYGPERYGRIVETAYAAALGRDSL